MNRRTVIRGAVAAGLASMPRGGVAGGTDQGEIQLPRPSRTGKMSVEEAIARRRSIREYAGQALGLEGVSQLLWATEGITGGTASLRAHPSAGGLHPLEVSLVTREGIFHYHPQGHRLVLVRSGDQRQALAKAAYGQWFVAEAPCVLAISAVYARTTGKYGERGRARYVPMDAAHAAQNALLQAVALGLAAVPVGAFDDEAVRLVLGAPADHVPMYLIPVGMAKA